MKVLQGSMNVQNAMFAEVPNGRFARCVKQKWMGGKTMTDAEKLRLIDTIIADAWENGEYGQEDGSFYKGVLSAITTVVNFEERDD